MQDKELLIVGAGPVGLSAGLFLHDFANVRIIEKLKEPSKHSKAFGVSPRTLQLLEPTGATAHFLQNGRLLKAINIYKNGKYLIKNDLTRVKHKYPFMLIQSQADSEAILSKLLEDKGISVQRGVELTSISAPQGEIFSEVINQYGKTIKIHSDLIMAADGAKSTVRKLIAMPFEGDAFEDDWILYDVELDTAYDKDEAHAFMLNDGVCFMVRIDAMVWRVISNNLNILGELPKNTTAGKIHWKSDFKISHRMVDAFSRNNIYFAGDASHIHSGLGARGMNLGIEDAFVFSKLFKDNKLADYNALRFPVVKQTITRIKFLTDIMRGKSLKSKTFRMFSPVIMPLVFPLVREKTIKFVLGVDHEV